jgi:hypothetical protein
MTLFIGINSRPITGDQWTIRITVTGCIAVRMHFRESAIR